MQFMGSVAWLRWAPNERKHVLLSNHGVATLEAHRAIRWFNDDVVLLGHSEDQSIGSMMMSVSWVISVLSRDMRAFPRCAIHAWRGRFGHLMWQSAWITLVEVFFSLGVPDLFKNTQQAEYFCVQAKSSVWSDRHLCYRRLH